MTTATAKHFLICVTLAVSTAMYTIGAQSDQPPAHPALLRLAIAEPLPKQVTPRTSLEFTAEILHVGGSIALLDGRDVAMGPALMLRTTKLTVADRMEFGVGPAIAIERYLGQDLTSVMVGGAVTMGPKKGLQCVLGGGINFGDKVGWGAWFGIGGIPFGN